MPSLKYEAETQRQHPRFRFPVHVTVDGEAIPAHDWSLGGFSVEGGARFEPGQRVSVTMVFPCNGFRLSVPFDAEVRYHRRDIARTGFQFVDPGERQLSLLRFIIDSYLSGESVEANEIWDVAGRSGDGKPRGIPPSHVTTFRGRVRRSGRRIVSAAAVLLLMGGLVAFLWGNVYEELYVIRADTANVSAKLINVASPAIGRIGFLSEKEQIGIGEPLMSVNPPAGNPITVQSPCDCLQVKQIHGNGDFVTTGEPIVQLVRRDTPVVITAEVPTDRLMSLYGVGGGTIVYADGQRVGNAEILWLPGQANPDNSLPQEPSTVVLSPGRDLNKEMVGQPVEVTFDLFASSDLGRIWKGLADGIAEARTSLIGDASTKVADRR